MLASFMVANACYLLLNRLGDTIRWDTLTGGPEALPLVFQVMVLAHTGLGILLTVVTLLFVGAHLPRVWARRHEASVASGAVLITAALILLASGLFILTAAASTANRWAWWSHVLAGTLGPAAYLAHRWVSHTRPLRGLVWRYVVSITSGTVALALIHAFTAAPDSTPESRHSLAEGRPQGPVGVNRSLDEHFADEFVAAGSVPPESPFFPSPATTSSGGESPLRILIPEVDRIDRASIAREAREQGFASTTLIGAETCVRCHADVTAQWATSAHRFSSFNNPFYEATLESLREQASTSDPRMLRHLDGLGLPEARVGSQRSQWCGACHDPALLFTLRMGDAIPRETPAAQAGLTCMACHAMTSGHDRTGNGNYNLSDTREDPYLFSGAAGGAGAFLHDAALKAKPTLHKRLLLKPYFRRSEYCLSCHKVSLSEPINEYRWLRAQNEYDDWDDSGVSLNASRTFYLPATRRVCQDCHMPPVPAPLGDLAADSGTVRSHRFTAANTALPFLRGDTASLRRIEAFLRDEKVSVDIFAIRLLGDGTTSMDPGEGGVPVRPGERIRVDVVVRNRGVGHTFPGGTNDSNESWLEVSVLGVDGTLLARSGGLEEDGSLDPLAHVFKSVLLDSEGKPIHDRNGARIHVTAASNVIGPGASDIAQYAFRVPETLDGEHLTVRARLLHRKFDSRYAEFAFNRNPDGFAGHDAVPELPIAEISVDELTVEVTGAPGSPSIGGSPWQSFNDYGIALLLQGSTLEARAVFEAVTLDSIGAFEGHLNLSRAALRDGNLESAFEHLERAENVRAGDSRAAWVWANAHQEDGSYSEAADAYRYVLRFFPGDRAAWRGLGRSLYLAGRYADALEAFASALTIDPEDRVSHYHTMLCLRALGREKEASFAEAAYERYRIDESAQAITGAFLGRDPGVNLMAQPIHTHTLELSGG
jgi:hypothetical protein